MEHIHSSIHNTANDEKTEEKEEIEALILKLGGVYKPDMARGKGVNYTLYMLNLTPFITIVIAFPSQTT